MPNLDITKQQAIDRLIAAGYPATAERVRRWRDLNGTDHGWERWITDHMRIPHIWRVIWPDIYVN